MITALRSMLKSHAYRVFLWIFLAVLIIGGISFDSGDNKPWVIKVYKNKSTELEYRASVSQLQRQYDYLKSQGISWPRNESIEKEVLRHMVTSSLMRHAGDQLNLTVPPILLQEQLAGQLSSLPAHFFDAKGQLNIAMLEKAIAPRSFEAFIAEMEQDIEANLLYNLISLGFYVPQFEVAMQYTEEFANKKYSILTISLQKALSRVKEKLVSDEVLERFYKKVEHADTYKSVEKRSGRYWKFNVKHYGLTVSKADVSEYYDKHKQSEFLEHASQVQVHRIFFMQDETNEAKSLAQTVHEELMQDPTTFASVAKKIAGAKLSSQGAEKTEFFTKDSDKYDKILVDTAFEQLTEDGAISNVIKTEKGYEIIQRIARKAAKYKTLRDVDSSIEDKLLEQKFIKRFKQDAERLVSNAHYNKEALHAFIEKKKGHEQVIDLEEKKMGALSMHLFQTDEGHYAVFMDGKEGVLLECTQIQKKALKPFNEIKSTVRDDYYKKQAQQELQAMVSDIMKQAGSKSFEDLARDYDAHMETVETTFKNGQMDIPASLRRPEISQKIKVLQSAGAVIDAITPSEGLVIRLDSIDKVDEKLFEEKKSSIEAVLHNKAKYKGRDSFIASLYRHAKLNNKIEIKDLLFKDAKDAEL